MRPLSTTVVSRQPSASARSASVCCQLIGAAVEPSDADDGIGEKIDRRGSHAAFAGDPCDDVPGNLVDAHFNASARTEEEASARMFVRGTAFERSAQQVEKFVVHVCLMVMVRCGIVRTTVLPSSTIVRLVRSRTGLPRATSIASTTVSLGFLAGACRRRAIVRAKYRTTGPAGEALCPYARDVPGNPRHGSRNP